MPQLVRDYLAALSKGTDAGSAKLLMLDNSCAALLGDADAAGRTPWARVVDAATDPAGWLR